jgi:hypothetical protein
MDQHLMNEIDIRAGARPYLVLGFTFLLLTVFGLFVAIRSSTHDWRFAYIPAGIGIGIVLYLRTIHLKIENGELSYKTLFRARRIRLTDIEKIENQLIGSAKGTYRALVVYPVPRSMEGPIRINIGPFSSDDLCRLFDALSISFKFARNISVYTDETV